MNLNLKSKMALAVSLLFILFSAAMTWFTLSYFHKKFEVALTGQQAALAGSIALSIENKLGMALTAMSGATAKMTPDVLADPERALEYLNSRPTLQAIFDDGIYFFSTKGRLIAESSYIPPHTTQEIRQFERLCATTATVAKAHITTYRFPTGTQGVFFSVPVFDGSGRMYAILAGGIDLHGKSFVEEISRIRIGRTGYLYICDTDRNIIVHQHRTADLQRLPKGAEALLTRTGAGTEGTGITVDPILGEMITSYKRLHTTEWIIVANLPSTEAFAPLIEARKYFIFATVLGTAVILLLAWFLMKRLMGPLHGMIRHISMVSDRPEEERFCTIDSRDELGTLARAFNGMVAALNSQQKTLEATAIRTRELNNNLLKKTAELELSNAEQEAFGYSLSHDLKTPLTRISLAAQTLVELYGDQLDESGLFCIENIQSGSSRMDEMIDGMLLLSRISRKDLAIETVDLSAAAEEIAARLHSEEPERTVVWSIEPSVSVNGDPRLLKSVLENLLGNAWKYTGKTPSPRIEFGTVPHGAGKAVVVRDNGAGFDPRKAETIFRPFHRLHGDDEFKGSGIGLATVQRIIRRHGGEIWAESEPGKGAAFYFTVPPAE